mmetsp:Transcript_18669/g.70629  ORF Transcript_18669/g.70629 Transcript_18669/m.70629 type:complete len:223 (-) Transcript_18669:358-1026(-)
MTLTVRKAKAQSRAGPSAKPKLRLRDVLPRGGRGVRACGLVDVHAPRKLDALVYQPPCYGFWGRIRLRRRASVDRHNDDHARVRRYPNLVGGARIQGQREGRLVLQGHAEQALVEVGVQHGLAGARPEAAILPRRLCEGTKVGQQLVRVDRIALRVVVTKPFYETGVDHVAKHAYELGVERVRALPREHPTSSAGCGRRIGSTDPRALAVWIERKVAGEKRA